MKLSKRYDYTWHGDLQNTSNQNLNTFGNDSLAFAAMTLLHSVRAQASGSRVGANLAPVSHTSDEEEDGSALGGGRFDRNVCRAAESDGDGGIYVEL